MHFCVDFIDSLCTQRASMIPGRKSSGAKFVAKLPTAIDSNPFYSVLCQHITMKFSQYIEITNPHYPVGFYIPIFTEKKNIVQEPPLGNCEHIYRLQG